MSASRLLWTLSRTYALWLPWGWRKTSSGSTQWSSGSHTGQSALTTIHWCVAFVVPFHYVEHSFTGDRFAILFYSHFFLLQEVFAQHNCRWLNVWLLSELDLLYVCHCLPIWCLPSDQGQRPCCLCRVPGRVPCILCNHFWCYKHRPGKCLCPQLCQSEALSQQDICPVGPRASD